jgi:uncharacterized protein YkwD
MRAGLVLGALCCLACISPPSAARRASTSSGTDAVVVVSEVERAMMEATNRERAAARLSPLRPDARLMRAAQLQAQQMARFGVMAHDLPRAAYPTFASRLEYARYPYSDAAENVAKNYGTGASVITGWMNSPHHRANMLAPRFTQVGSGFATDGAGDKYYAEVFGRPR